MKTIFAFLVALLLQTLCDVRGASVVEGPKATVTNTNAVIRWKTDVSCGTRVYFGISKEKMDGKAGDGVGFEHSVSLGGLEPGQTYYYSVGTARYLLNSGSFTTSGTASRPGGNIERGGPTNPPPTAAVPKDGFTIPPFEGRTPPTRQIWGNLSSLPDHFERHGSDFHASSPDDYARQAWEFLQHAIDQGLPVKFDENDNTLRTWDPKTHSFGAYNKDGTAKTYFKPKSSDYFQRQPGKPIQLKR
ncbi:MAG: hypothetical protein JWL90_3724 [Chthoniobacteraceae bacterium]|nr:hypothetical protein [Chthoniobacteraceae bacterium]